MKEFGGLQLGADPVDVGANQAQAGLNFDVVRPGEVRSRYGTAQINADAFNGNSWQWLTTYPSDTIFGQLIAMTMTTGGTLKTDRIIPELARSVINVGTTIQTTDFRVTSSTLIGTTSTILLFFAGWADRSTGTLLRKYGGAGVATSVGKPLYVTTMPEGNRLVQAHYIAAADSPSGANGTTSTVFFSDPGAPETYTATNWVQLMPGDGEDIVGAVTWNEKVYIFKQTRVFEFYSTTTGPDGNPVFNYRAINLPTKLPGRVAGSGSTPGNLEFPHVISSPAGIFFTNRQGVWRLTNTGLSRISSSIEAQIFSDDPAQTNRVLDSPILSYANGRLFCYYVTGASAKRTLVYNVELDLWTIWDQFERAADYPSGFAARDLAFFAVTPSANTPAIYVQSPAYTDDNGTAIASSYQSGWYDLSDSAAEAFTRRTQLTGTGSPTVSVLTDFGTSDASAAAVTLGTAPTLGHGWHPKAYKGRFFSHKFSATSGAWSVSQLQHDISSVRP